MGATAKIVGDLDHSYNAVLEALHADPDDIEAAAKLGHILAKLGRHAEAIDWFERVLAKQPNRSDVLNNLGAVWMSLGQAHKAEGCLIRAVQVDPGFATAWGNLGVVQAVRGRALAPIRSLQRALTLAPNDLRLRNKIGQVLGERGHLQAAQVAFSQVIRRQPDDIEAITGLATILHRTGRDPEAWELLAKRAMGDVVTPNLAAAFTQVCITTGRAASAQPVVRAALDQAMDHPARVLLYHNLGDILDATGQTDQAFAAYRAANALRDLNFDPDAHAVWVDRLVAQPVRKGRRALNAREEPSAQPILIVGMPRSGTSLVEQILSAHPAVHACGEREDLRQLSILASRWTSSADYPDALANLDTVSAQRLGRCYLERLGGSESGAQRITDKMPHNFLYLGLAARILPNCRVIHCVRDPVDTGLSCFMQNFPDTLAFTTRLDWIADWTHAYRRLMHHWAQVLPLPIFTVRYASLVADPTTWIRRIIAFSGLDWDPRCLSFHTQQRVVHTASHAQVRRPIDTSRVGRSDPYWRHLRPLHALRRSKQVSQG